MQVFHRAVPFTGEDIRQHAEGKIDAGVELLLLGARRAAQDEVGYQFGVTRVADAKRIKSWLETSGRMSLTAQSTPQTKLFSSQ